MSLSHRAHLALAVVAALSLTGCAKKDDWTAFVFPDQQNIPNAGDVESYIHGKYPALELARLPLSTPSEIQTVGQAWPATMSANSNAPIATTWAGC